MTPKETVVVRDALSSMKFAENEFSRERFSTSSLFEHISLGAPQSGAAFELQVRKWIEAVAESWFDGLPPDAVRAMVPDVIGHITGAVIEEHRPEHRSAG